MCFEIRIAWNQKENYSRNYSNHKTFTCNTKNQKYKLELFRFAFCIYLLMHRSIDTY
jgi:hypothetical protein